MRTRTALALLPALPLLAGCAIVRQDEVGVSTRLGRVGDRTLPPGAKAVLPGVTGVITLPARTVNREVRLELPSREGLNIAADVSILYRIRPEMAPRILETAGRRYEEDIVIPVFRSAAADVTAKFLAKDMHSGERMVIERAIREQMATVLEARGFVVENVLLKSIRLPADLARAIEQKLEAEQRAEQMRFVLDRERQEAERRKIEAAGIRDAQAIISSGLTPMLISWQSIEAFRELARSPNTKVILTDGRTPMLIGNDLVGSEARPTAPAPRTRPASAPSRGDVAQTAP